MTIAAVRAVEGRNTSPSVLLHGIASMATAALRTVDGRNTSPSVLLHGIASMTTAAVQKYKSQCTATWNCKYDNSCTTYSGR
jgi:hypothetical protein